MGVSCLLVSFIPALHGKINNVSLGHFNTIIILATYECRFSKKMESSKEKIVNPEDANQTDEVEVPCEKADESDCFPVDGNQSKVLNTKRDILQMDESLLTLLHNKPKKSMTTRIVPEGIGT